MTGGTAPPPGPKAVQQCTRVLGLLLAGGLARRMGGGDKCLLTLAGRPLLAHAIDRLRPQVSAMAISAVGDPGRFAAFGLEVVEDAVPGRQGPLAGILAGLELARAASPPFTHVLSVAADTPFFPVELERALAQASGTDDAIALATSDGRDHPTFARWPAGLADAMRRALVERGERGVGRFALGRGAVRVAFPGQPFDPFFNINTRADLEAARARAASIL